MSEPSESKLWLEIARAFETPPSRRTEWQCRLADSGLCLAVDEYDWKRRDLSTPLVETMYGRIEQAARDLGKDDGKLFWPASVRLSDKKRAALARKFARQAQREARKVKRG